MEYPIRISNRIVKPKTKTYKQWWNSPIDPEDSMPGNRITTNGQFVKDFYNDISTILNECGYQIDNEKKLKNKIVTIIYTLSNDSV
jgi:hypothetical protein